jgi:hypothetical protein
MSIIVNKNNLPAAKAVACIGDYASLTLLDARYYLIKRNVRTELKKALMIIEKTKDDSLESVVVNMQLVETMVARDSLYNGDHKYESLCSWLGVIDPLSHMIMTLATDEDYRSYSHIEDLGFVLVLTCETLTTAIELILEMDPLEDHLDEYVDILLKGAIT